MAAVIGELAALRLRASIDAGLPLFPAAPSPG
jgi:hypothetical protein